ncbi:hypothetical protein L916_18103 [Phytophthora nicotianae]|uniref:Uncharacterized protein n=1 Tax=Phytophthora nicotianae TaxID=4792 RepID=W2I2Y0_PHYNI|nr:hypothetical protein L916_18103 [Phytophthora nicotianae]
MKRLGIDVKRAFEQLANTHIELNQDDLSEEPEVGDVADDEMARELERMCEEVKVVLRDDQYTEFREKVTKLSKAFHRLWGLGLVQMNQHWFNLWW